MNAKIDEVARAAKDVLSRDRNILVGYIYGSLARGSKSPRDIDVGILLRMPGFSRSSLILSPGWP